MEKKQIVIFGGCFNPPLNSHFLLAEQLVNEYPQIEKVIFVPVNNKYQKNDLVQNEHRYNMLKLVCDKNIRFEVSSLEMDSSRPLFTIETLDEFQKMYPDKEITFVMGSDNLKEFSKWDRVQGIIDKYKVYVLERDKDNIDEIIKSDEFLNENKETFIKAKNNITSNFSSTYVRERLRNNKSIKYLTPDEVVNYINKNKLYK